jgi:hypothetical protein
MAGGSFEFEVRPRVLSGYADVLRGCAAELGVVGEAAAGVTVERRWFGRLPQAGLLSDRYEAHRGGVIAEVGELSEWLAEAGAGLRDSAGRYSAADRVVTEVAEGVAADVAEGLPASGRSGEVVEDASHGGGCGGGGASG